MAQTAFATHKADLGYGLLLKRYTDNVVDATPEQIDDATRHSIPKVAPMFWTFRGMVFCGVMMLFIFTAAFYFNAKRTAHKQRWLLRLAFYGMPLPWIASELGWVVAEYGRQPWTIAGILPTHLSTSSVAPEQLYLSLAGFFLFYTTLLVIELFLMLKYVRLGPSSLHTGRYHFEQLGADHV
jgi:cytochrome d ubiquinol oxidase subunit I